MSDFPNGTPPGQNNLDATVERYVPLENDPSATAQKSAQSDYPKEAGLPEEVKTDPEVEKELAEASKNFVEPGSVEDHQQEQTQQEETPPPPPPPTEEQVPTTTKSTTRRS